MEILRKGISMWDYTLLDQIHFSVVLGEAKYIYLPGAEDDVTSDFQNPVVC